MKRVVFSIQYAGLTLPVMQNEQGQDVTPLKPISDLFGLRWTQQREKVTNSAYFSRFLGTCTLTSWGAGTSKPGEITPQVGGDGGQKREQTCILVSRVAAYLMGINPEMVRAKGNQDGAKFLEEKQEEWADALHDYEEIGCAVNLNHAKQQEQTRKMRAAFFQGMGVQNRTENAAARKAVGELVQQMAAELGIQYQPDLS